MATEHTEGPWEAILSERSLVKLWVIRAPSHQLATVHHRMNSSRGQYDADARLIAAAPDLLAALQSLLDDSPYNSDAESCECGDGEHDAADPCCHIAAHRAIAKATGAP